MTYLLVASPYFVLSVTEWASITMSSAEYSPHASGNSRVSTVAPMFFVVSVRKLLVMQFFTLGFYLTYWGYRNWKLYKAATGARVMPLVRCLFNIFFIYSLLAKVDRRLDDEGRGHAWSPAWLTFTLVVSALGAAALYKWVSLFPVMSLIANFGLLIVQSLALAKIQRGINFCEADLTGKANARLTPANWAWIAPGALLWVVSVVMTVSLVGGA